MRKKKVLFEEKKEFFLRFSGKRIEKMVKMELKDVWKGFFYLR